MNTGLFKEEPLCSKLTLKITAPADDSVGCGVLVYALRDLGSGMYNLGSGDAIGQGYLKGDRLEIAVSSVKGQQSVLMQMAGAVWRTQTV